MKKEFYLLVLSLGLILSISAMEPEEQKEGWFRWAINYFFVRKTNEHEIPRSNNAQVSQPSMSEPSLPDKIKLAVCNHEPEVLKEYFRTIRPDDVIIEMPLIEKASNNEITMIPMSPMTFYFEYALFESHLKSVAVLKALLESGGDPNGLLLDKNPVLFKAAQKDKRLVALLLEEGVNPFICGRDGKTLLFNPKLSTEGGDLLRSKAQERNGDLFKKIAQESGYEGH